MGGYTRFAQYYDELMCNVDYAAVSDYLLKLFEKHSKKPELLLDIACGTGSLAVELAKRGIEVIGNDSSFEMLSLARRKADLNNVNIMFLMQKMQDIDLYGTVDGAVSTFDSLNHITDINELGSVFKKISLFIEDGGLFIFDMNTEYKQSSVLADNAFVFETENVYCVWQNKYLNKKKLTRINLDFFTAKGKNIYERSSEEFLERAFTDEEIQEVIKNSDFEFIALYGEKTFLPPKKDEQRVFYVIKKKERDI